MHIEINPGSENLDKSPKEARVHYLPGKIHADCDADISGYFETSIAPTAEPDEMSGSLRGRPLLGRRIRLPEGYMGALLHESLRPDTEDCNRRFYVTNTFRSFVSWNWDKRPTREDALNKALDWIQISEALNKRCKKE